MLNTNLIEEEEAKINNDNSMYPYCKQCSELRIVSGQAFTKFICAHCFELSVHHNTAVTKICTKCSRKYHRCKRCCKHLNFKNE